MRKIAVQFGIRAVGTKEELQTKVRDYAVLTGRSISISPIINFEDQDDVGLNCVGSEKPGLRESLNRSTSSSFAKSILTMVKELEIEEEAERARDEVEERYKLENDKL